MNRKQWSVFAIGTLILAAFLWALAFWWNCTSLIGSSVHTACIIKQQSYAIPALFCTVFAPIFFFCASLERKDKHKNG